MKACYYKGDISKICDHKHLTVDEIFTKIAEKYPEAWRSSIYRNVECMVQSWELRKVVWIWNKAYFEKNNWNHMHLIDNETWNIIDFDGELSFSNLPKNFNIDKSDIKLFWSFS